MCACVGSVSCFVECLIREMCTSAPVLRRMLFRDMKCVSVVVSDLRDVSKCSDAFVSWKMRENVMLKSGLSGR